MVFVCLFVNKVAAQPNIPGPQPGTAPLKGFVDLHTHPLSNLGFSGKLLYGGVDVGALLPADPNCNHDARATSMQQALGNCNSTHGGVNLISNQCGDVIRNQVIQNTQQKNDPQAAPCGDGNGAPNFDAWPAWNDITHQSMWVDWIRRSYLHGLRVMVALAVNNKTLADMVGGPGDGPDDDKASADLQLRELKAFVGRHSGFMEIALSSSDLERIVRSNKLAVVPGIEIDHIGDFGTPGHTPENRLTDAEVINEIDRLFSEGVRYIFPIHLLDNPFGGTATYQDLMNYSTFRESGHWWSLRAVPGFTYRFQSQNGFPLDVAILAKLGLTSGSTYGEMNPPNYQPPPKAGEANSLGLSGLGRVAIREMMRLGMLIDIDHMSDLAKDQTIAIATEVAGGYPLNSGHAGLRFVSVEGSNSITERSMNVDQYKAIFKLHGMAGIGSAGQDAYAWTKMYISVLQIAGPGAVAGFGTDANGISPLMPPRGSVNFGDISRQRFWTGNFTVSGQTQIMFYHQQDNNWWLGTFQEGKLTWTLAGNAKGFGDISRQPFWTGDYTGSGHAEIMFYHQQDGNWWLGTFQGSRLTWTLAGNTTGFGDISKRHFWTGNFTGAGHSQIMFYSPGDGNWWLGTFQGAKLTWELAGNTKGFGNIDGQPFWSSDFTGSGHAQVMFYHQQDNSWWLGTFQADKLTWVLAENTKGFGDISRQRFWTGDFTGSGHAEIMFYHQQDGNWWLGTFQGTQLAWTLACNTKGFGDISEQPFWTDKFTGSRGAGIMFYHQQDNNWWLGTFQGDKLTWALACNTKGFGDISRQPFWTSDFTAAGHSGIMFYHQQDGNWWSGAFQGPNLTWTLAGNTAGIGYYQDIKYDNSFPMCSLGNKSWDYNLCGVAHYGLLPDFLKDVVIDTRDGGPTVYNNLMTGAEYFLETWKKCETVKANIH